MGVDKRRMAEVLLSAYVATGFIVFAVTAVTCELRNQVRKCIVHRPISESESNGQCDGTHKLWATVNS